MSTNGSYSTDWVKDSLTLVFDLCRCRWRCRPFSSSPSGPTSTWSPASEVSSNVGVGHHPKKLRHVWFEASQATQSRSFSLCGLHLSLSLSLHLCFCPPEKEPSSLRRLRACDDPRSSSAFDEVGELFLHMCVFRQGWIVHFSLILGK